jgi:hypothetical protein
MHAHLAGSCKRLSIAHGNPRNSRSEAKNPQFCYLEKYPQPHRSDSHAIGHKTHGRCPNVAEEYLKAATRVAYLDKKKSRKRKQLTEGFIAGIRPLPPILPTTPRRALNSEGRLWIATEGGTRRGDSLCQQRGTHYYTCPS